MNSNGMVATPYKEVRSVKSKKKKNHFEGVRMEERKTKKIRKLYFVTQGVHICKGKG